MTFNQDYERIGRFTNAALGGWTLVSVAALPRLPYERLSAALVGVLVIGFALGSYYRVKWLHWVNMGLGAWLFSMPWFLGSASVGTVINDMIVGTLVFSFGCYPQRNLAEA